jgi:ABC-type nitrate/sulfonate/bicarbonate transport system substrate-binding protein
MKRRLFLGSALALSAAQYACISAPRLSNAPLDVPAKLKLALISNLFEYAPIWIAVDQGYFKAEGIDASFTVLGSVPRVTELTRAGEYEFGVGVPEGVVADVEAGGPLRFVGGLSRKVAVSLITQRHIKSVAQLKGAKLGVSGLKEGTGILMQDVMTRYGMKASDIELVLSGIHTTRWERLQKGEIDAALQPFPFNLMAVEKGFNNLAEFPDLVPAYQFIAIAARKDWLDANTELAARSMRAIRKGVASMHNNKELAIRLGMTQAGLTREYAEKTWDYYTSKEVVHPDARIDERALRKTLETMVKAGTLPAEHAVSIERYVDERAILMAMSG